LRQFVASRADIGVHSKHLVENNTAGTGKVFGRAI
jgi:hypothetical protein